MDISIFEKYYFKKDLISIEEAFVPFNYSGLGFDFTFNERPFGDLTESILEQILYHFSWSTEDDITYDTLTMFDMIGVSNDKLLDLDIEVDYSQIEQAVKLSDFQNALQIFIKHFEEDYLRVFKCNILEAQTNVRASHFFDSQMKIIKNSFANLIEILDQIELKKIQRELVSQYKSSYCRLFEKIEATYIDSFPNLIETVRPIFKGKKEKNNHIHSNRNGLIMNEGLRMSPRKASKFCESLKKHGFIEKGTRSDTFQNLFKKDTSESVITKVGWKGTIRELKYLIDWLFKNKIIKQSGYQQKWIDTSNCFYKEGFDINNESFNTKPEISIASAKQLNRILGNLKAEFGKKLM